MKLLIKQRVFSWTDSYDVYDEKGEKKFFVKAEFFTLGHQLHVYDNAENEIGAIHQKIMSFLPTFEIERNGTKLGTIQKEFTFFKQKYDIDYKGWHIEGDFFDWDFDVWDGNRRVAHISKELFHWGDTYVIDIENPQDELDGLMLVIAIDAVNSSNASND